MLAFRHVGFGDWGTYPTMSPGAPNVQPPIPNVPTRGGSYTGGSSTGNTSSQAMLDMMDNADPKGMPKPPQAAQPIFAAETFLPSSPTKIVGLAPLGIAAIGMALIGLWVALR